MLLATCAALTLVLTTLPEGQGASPALRAGGALTHEERNRDAFAQPAPVLDRAALRVFGFGNRIFNTQWVTAPASVGAFDGLGPTFNRNSCSGCHLRDGRGQPPQPGESGMDSMLIRWSVPGRSTLGGPKPVPNYGDQLNDRAVHGVPAEAQAQLRWVESSGSYADGSPYRLRRPIWRFQREAFGPLPRQLRISARVAPAVIGMGLLDAIPAADLIGRADPHDRDHDGISGRVNWVPDLTTGERRPGRFGWKAGVPSLLAQNAAAALGDIGLSSRWLPAQNCPGRQRKCKEQAHGGQPELIDEHLRKLTTYTQLLGVPAQRNKDDPIVRHGGELFARYGCADCHHPVQRTSVDASPALLAAQSFQPFTDLLLHDMGAGLADHRAEFGANGREWRTAPLWGIGLIPIVNGHQYLLHDGRARGIAEAILWHDGEAQAARDAFLRATATEREQLVAFVNSL